MLFRSAALDLSNDEININYANSNLYSYVNYDGSFSLVNFATNVNDGVWRYIVWTLQPNGTYNYYINGILTYTATGIYPKLITRNANRLLTNNTNSLNGSMDEFRFYNRAVSSSEVSILYYYPNSIIYASNFYSIIPTNSLSLYYPFDNISDSYSIIPTTGLTM